MLRVASGFFAATVISVAFAAAVVVTQRYVDRQVDVGRAFRADMAQWRAATEARHRDYDARLEALERTVYGEQRQPPPPTIKVGPELWQRNRDRELRERISALEKRFLRLESAFRDEGR